MTRIQPDHPCPNRHGPLLPGPGGAAVFLDRDGVLIEDTGYPDDPQALALLPGVGTALRRLREAGLRLVVVTNQSGVARGRFDLARLAAIHDRLTELLAAEGAAPDALYFCPHHPEGRPPFARACDHRKPAPGMLLTAAAELGLALSRSWMIGDREADVAAGLAAGTGAILVGAGPTAAAAAVADLAAAAEFILARPR
jgi:D-glycero-D-manno-heptose 1,7-bisphosphate phosphatase